LAKATILVVEDDPDIRELVSYNLGKEGYTVAAAESGERALELLPTANPDLILLDIMLPGADGLDVLRSLKGEPASSRIPVILATAKSEDTDIITGLELGADDYRRSLSAPRC
jgi:two-component system phosphate regulon response regulator PhoB